MVFLSLCTLIHEDVKPKGRGSTVAPKAGTLGAMHDYRAPRAFPGT